MAWTQYTQPPDFLNVEDVNKIYANMVYIRSAMVNKGLTVSNLQSVSAKNSTLLVDVVGILNRIEYNIDALNTAYPSEFYKKSVYYEPGGVAPDKEKVWRWINLLNDWYRVFVDDTNYTILKCANGYPVINGKKISIQE